MRCFVVGSDLFLTQSRAWVLAWVSFWAYVSVRTGSISNLERRFPLVRFLITWLQRGRPRGCVSLIILHPLGCICPSFIILFDWSGTRKSRALDYCMGWIRVHEFCVVCLFGVFFFCTSTVEAAKPVMVWLFIHLRRSCSFIGVAHMVRRYHSCSCIAGSH